LGGSIFLPGIKTKLDNADRFPIRKAAYTGSKAFLTKKAEALSPLFCFISPPHSRSDFGAPGAEAAAKDDDQSDGNPPKEKKSKKVLTTAPSRLP
jgi:hypothetical protein